MRLFMKKYVNIQLNASFLFLDPETHHRTLKSRKARIYQLVVQEMRKPKKTMPATGKGIRFVFDLMKST
jgi:hypothetical protein